MYTMYYGWRHLVKATEVTAGLAESNGSLPPGGWLKVTCWLTACTPGSAPGPTLGSGRIPRHRHPRKDPREEIARVRRKDV